MQFFLKRFGGEIFALMRIMTGFLFLWHGSMKLFGFPPGMPAGAPAFIVYFGGAVEFFGGLLVLFGLFTRWAAFLCSGEMAVAYWMAHGTKTFLPVLNGGELAVLYCFVFLYVASRGSGPYGIDRGTGGRRASRSRR